MANSIVRRHSDVSIQDHCGGWVGFHSSIQVVLFMKSTHRGRALNLDGNMHTEVDNDIAEDLEGDDNDNEDVDAMELDV
jgi:hypothetical protein